MEREKDEKMYEKRRRNENEKAERDETAEGARKERRVHACKTPTVLRGQKAQDIGRLHSEFLHYWSVYASNYKRSCLCALLLNSNSFSCLNYRLIKLALRRKIIFYLYNGHKINVLLRFMIFATVPLFSPNSVFKGDIQIIKEIFF